MFYEGKYVLSLSTYYYLCYLVYLTHTRYMQYEWCVLSWIYAQLAKADVPCGLHALESQYKGMPPTSHRSTFRLHG